MPLDLDQIQELYKKQATTPVAKTKFIRLNRQYPRLPEDGNVTRSDRAIACASRGCRTPTYLKLGGVAYCAHHMIFALVIENTELKRQIKHEDKLNGNSSSDTSVVVP